MNNAVKGLIGISIFGAGIGAGWLIAKNHYAKIMEEELAEINRQVKAELNAMYGNARMPVSEETEDYEEEESAKPHDPSKDFTDEVPKVDPFEGMSQEEIEEARNHHRRVVTDYASMYKPSLNDVAVRKGILTSPTSRVIDNDIEDDEPEEYEDAETDEEREIREGEALGRVNHERPYIIEPEQYDTECEHYDKIDLFYYVRDDSLIDENDMPVDDVEDFLDAIRQLEMQTNVYIRNEVVGADYALHRINRSYSEDVLGISETPRERDARHIARRKEIMDGE